MTDGEQIPDVLCSMKDAVVEFGIGRGRKFAAVNGVNLELRRGEVVGLIGESGSGKSTLARALLGLVPLAAGEVVWHGKNVSSLNRSEMQQYRAGIQMVFQDPHSALNPRKSVIKSVREPMDVLNIHSRSERKQIALQMFEKVGLSDRYANRYPHELSGGQKQRINIARALVTNAKVLVCDESVAALDVALQAEILNLLGDLKTDLGLTILFISHDLSVVSHISDRIEVMYLGDIVEKASTSVLVKRPVHPYSEAVMSAQPLSLPDSAKTHSRIVLRGDIPSPIDPPAGCKFHTRCQYAVEKCQQEVPELVETSVGSYGACLRMNELDLNGVEAVVYAKGSDN